ncbi:MAG: DUF421 domain-containing protein [Bacillota bacterium]
MYMLNLTLELVLGLGALSLVTQLLGPTQIGKLTPFHFISSLVLGELLGNAIYEQEIGFLYVIYALTLWTSMMLLMEWVSRRYPTTRSVLQGNPELLIRRGLIQYEALRRKRLNIRELQILLRGKGAFTIREVEYAILEPDGSMSILRKPVYEQPTRHDLGLPRNPGELPVTFISDGVVLGDNLKDSGYDMGWLLGQLRAQGVEDPEDVMFAEWQEGEGLLVQRYNQSFLPPFQS